VSKRKLSIWVEDDLADRIQAMAKVERLTVSQFGAQMLERSVTQWADNMGWDMVGIRVQDTVAREVGRMSDRLANLMVRAALESTATRAVVYNDRMRVARTDQEREDVKRANSQAWTYAIDRLKSPVAAVAELLKGG